jgi:glycosyltransferase involved in cell wall biosynthesis
VVGPTPPPLQGMSVYTAMLVRPGGLDRAVHVVHMETADRRSMENMGRLDVRNVWLAVAHAWRLLVLIARHRPDVVYVPLAQNRLAYLRDVVFMALARVTGRRLVTHLHGSAFRDFHDGSGRVLRWVIRRSLGWSAAVVVLSERLRWVFEGLVPSERIRVAAAGVEDAFPGGAPPARRGSGRGDEGRITVGYLGLFYRPKGFVTLLAAAAALHARAPGRYRFVFAGDWFSNDERTAAAAVAGPDGLGGTLSLGPPVDGAGKRSFLESVDILVFPGEQPEGLPLVVLEGMSAGRAVVATSVGAIPDVVVPDRTGVLVEPGDVDALVSAIEALAADPEARANLGRGARELYLDHYTEERCIERMAELLRTA